MQSSFEKTRYIFIFTVISAVFFLFGLVMIFSLPSDSILYEGLENTVSDIAFLNSKKTDRIDLSVFISSFFSEIKYLFFAFISCFSFHRYKLFIALNSYRGLLSGFGCALFLRTEILDAQFGRITFLSAFTFIAVCVSYVIILCVYCSECLLFSRKIIYPIKLSVFFKRRDTYSFIFSFLAFCGAVLIITFIKIGNMFFIIS